MNTLNFFYFLTCLSDCVAMRLAPRTLFAERLYWLREDVRLLRRVMRIVRKAGRLQPFTERPGSRALADCMIARAARIMGYWQYHRPMNHVLVMHAFDIDMTAVPTEAEQNAGVDAFLASQYADDERPVTEKV